MLLKADRDTKLDIWKVDALILELVFGLNIFYAWDKRGVYSVARHLEEMASLLDPFIIDRVS